MSNRSITIEHNGTNYAGQIGTIKSTHLGYEDHGILTVSLGIEWVGGGVSVGGYCLDQSNPDYSRKGTAYGLDHILRIMETVGVDSWEQLKGKQIIVLSEGSGGWGSQAVGIAHPTDDSKVFVLKEHSEAWRAAEASE